MENVTTQTQYQTMTEIAETILRDRIVYGVYPAGSRLIPAALEKELRLGRVPIREALKGLAGKGLVSFLPNRGAVVASTISFEELKEIFDLRYELEGKAAFHAAQRITPEALDELRQINEKTRTPASAYEYLQDNRSFHLKVYASSNWHFLNRIVIDLYDQMLLVRSQYPQDLSRSNNFAEEHLCIINALANKDSEMAKKYTQAHISHLFRELTPAQYHASTQMQSVQS